jgi:hypothetical protein
MGLLIALIAGAFAHGLVHGAKKAKGAKISAQDVRDGVKVGAFVAGYTAYSFGKELNKVGKE